MVLADVPLHRNFLQQVCPCIATGPPKPRERAHSPKKNCPSVRVLDGQNLGDHQPYTATTRDFGSKKGFQRGWCTNCQNLRENSKIYTTPRIALAMFIMAFVGVVRGLWGSKNRQSPIASVQRTRSTLASHSAIPRGTNVKRMNANRTIRIAAQRTQGL